MLRFTFASRVNLDSAAKAACRFDRFMQDLSPRGYPHAQLASKSKMKLTVIELTLISQMSFRRLHVSYKPHCTSRCTIIVSAPSSTIYFPARTNTTNIPLPAPPTLHPTRTRHSPTSVPIPGPQTLTHLASLFRSSHDLPAAPRAYPRARPQCSSAQIPSCSKPRRQRTQTIRA